MEEVVTLAELEDALGIYARANPLVRDAKNELLQLVREARDDQRAFEKVRSLVHEAELEELNELERDVKAGASMMLPTEAPEPEEYDDKPLDSIDPAAWPELVAKRLAATELPPEDFDLLPEIE